MSCGVGAASLQMSVLQRCKNISFCWIWVNSGIRKSRLANSVSYHIISNSWMKQLSFHYIYFWYYLLSVVLQMSLCYELCFQFVAPTFSSVFTSTGIPHLALSIDSKKKKKPLSEGNFSTRINVSVIYTLNLCFGIPNMRYILVLRSS